MLLSICVPTYNRGKHALELAKELEEIWKKYPNDVEIIFSNNGSTKETEEYKKLSEMSSEHFIYFEFSENKNYVGNYNQVIRLAKGDWALLVSDEDHIEIENLDKYLNIMRNHPEASLIRAKADLNYAHITGGEKCYKAGNDAINAYFLSGNYISGIIYNRRFLSNEVIDKLEKDYLFDSDNKAYYSYPHLFVEGLLSLVGDILICGDILIHEGDPVSDQIKDSSANVSFYAGFEERLEQTKGYFEFVEKLKCSNTQKVPMITRILDKTIWLLVIVKDKYLQDGFDWNQIADIVVNELADMILMSNMDVIKLDRQGFLGYLDELKKDLYV